MKNLVEHNRTTYLVRTKSSGARTNPVTTAAPAATPSAVHGCSVLENASNMSSSAIKSGTLNIAASTPRDQFSISDAITLYMNDALVAFHVPPAPSFCQCCEMTSGIESGFVMTSCCAGAFDDRGDLVLCLLGKFCLWGVDAMPGETLDVKYSGSPSESESWVYFLGWH